MQNSPCQWLLYIFSAVSPPWMYPEREADLMIADNHFGVQIIDSLVRCHCLHKVGPWIVSIICVFTFVCFFFGFPCRSVRQSWFVHNLIVGTTLKLSACTMLTWLSVYMNTRTRLMSELMPKNLAGREPGWIFFPVLTCIYNLIQSCVHRRAEYFWSRLCHLDPLTWSVFR